MATAELFSQKKLPLQPPATKTLPREPTEPLIPALAPLAKLPGRDDSRIAFVTDPSPLRQKGETSPGSALHHPSLGGCGTQTHQKVATQEPVGKARKREAPPLLFPSFSPSIEVQPLMAAMNSSPALGYMLAAATPLLPYAICLSLA